MLFRSQAEEELGMKSLLDQRYSSAAALADLSKLSPQEQMAKLEEMSRHRYIPALYFGMIHNSLGEPSETFRFAWKALGERSDYFMYLRLEPLVGKTAGNPEFIRLLGMIHR